MKYTTVVFDLDGTLLNTLDDLAGSVNFALRENGLPQRTIDEVRRFIGNGVRVLIRRAVPAGTTDDLYERTFKTFEDHYRKNSRNLTAPYEGIMELLNDLKECGAFEKIKEYLNNGGVVFGGSAGAIIFGKDLEACRLDDVNEVNILLNKYDGNINQILENI